MLLPFSVKGVYFENAIGDKNSFSLIIPYCGIYSAFNEKTDNKYHKNLPFSIGDLVVKSEDDNEKGIGIKDGEIYSLEYIYNNFEQVYFIKSFSFIEGLTMNTTYWEIDGES